MRKTAKKAKICSKFGRKFLKKIPSKKLKQKIKNKNELSCREKFALQDRYKCARKIKNLSSKKLAAQKHRIRNPLFILV